MDGDTEFGILVTLGIASFIGDIDIAIANARPQASEVKAAIAKLKAMQHSRKEAAQLMAHNLVAIF